LGIPERAFPALAELRAHLMTERNAIWESTHIAFGAMRAHAIRTLM
jgi:hypothetical protein